MRVICPHCQKTVTLADTVASLPTPCPACGHVFTAPTLMAPEPPPPVAETAPAVAPPVTVTPANPAANTPASVASPEHTAPPPITPPPSTNVPGLMRFELSKKALHWVGPVAFIALFFFSFWTWIGSYAIGTREVHTVYSQSAWSIFAGTFYTNPSGETVFDREKLLHENSSAGWSMVFALLLLIPFLLIAVLDLAQDYVNFAVPDIVQAIWPRRLAVLALISGIIWFLLTIQLLSSVGLESAAATAADKFVAPATPEIAAKIDASTTLKIEQDLKRGAEFNRYGLRRGIGLTLGYLASLIAFAGFGLEYWMDRRGKRKPPAVELQW